MKFHIFWYQSRAREKWGKYGQKIEITWVEIFNLKLNVKIEFSVNWIKSLISPELVPIVYYKKSHKKSFLIPGLNLVMIPYIWIKMLISLNSMIKSKDCVWNIEDKWDDSDLTLALSNVSPSDSDVMIDLGMV